MLNMRNYVFLVTTFIACITLSNQLQLIDLRESHYSRDLSPDHLLYLSSLTNVTHINEVLDNICVPRVVGTQPHSMVHDYIISEISSLGWHVEEDEFKEATPNFGVLKFRNIIATLNPEAARFLVLACHYDSKYFREFEFVGAIDSAVPCAMMLNLASVLRKELLNAKGNTDLSLKLIFFDGEEAFESWGPKDSIYGARHLAEKLQGDFEPRLGEKVSGLDRIDVLVLLDLLGTRNPTFHSYFRSTQRWYNQLHDVEQQLTNLGAIKRDRNTQPYFRLNHLNAGVEDDHLPFLRRGVPILHLIPVPFPKVWHKVSDNRNSVDIETVENLNKILRAFVVKYINLSVTF